MSSSAIITRAIIMTVLQLVTVCLVARAQSEDGSWRPGAGPYGGKITALIAAADGSIIAGTSSGIYRSTDNGGNWSLQSSNIPFLPVNGLARDSAGILYAATSPGVYRSLNNGQTWSRFMAEHQMMMSIAIHDGIDVLAGKDQGIRIFDDAFSSWTSATYRDLSPTTVITTIASQNTTVYLGTSDAGLYRSDDGGKTIQSVQGIPCSAIYSIDMRSSDSGEVALVVGTACGLYRWSTSSPVWTEFSGPLSGRPVTAVKLIGTALYAGTKGFGIFRTYDGVNWTEVYNGMENATINTVEGVGNGSIFCGTLHGVQRSDNQGERWEVASAGIRSTVIRSLVVNEHGYLFACTETGVYRSTDRGANWQEKNHLLTDRDVQCLYLSPDGSIWAGTRGGKLFRSNDDGESWVERQTTNTITGSVNAVLFGSDARLMVGKSGGMVTYEDPGMWRIDMGGVVEALARVGSTVYALTSSGGLYKSANNGDSAWSDCLKGTGYTALSVDADERVLVGGANDVAISNSGGNTWISISWTPPCTPYRAVMIDADGNMIVGTDCGPFRSTNGGGVWGPYREGLNAPITAFAQYPDKLLVAGTDGAGIFFREATPASTVFKLPDADASSLTIHAAVSAGLATLTVRSPGRYVLALHDPLGQRVRVITDRHFDIGSHQINHSFADLSSGVYLLNARGAGCVATMKVLVDR